MRAVLAGAVALAALGAGATAVADDPLPRWCRGSVCNADVVAAARLVALSIAAGETATLEVTLTNKGPDPAYKLGLKLTLPSRLSVVSTTGLAAERCPAALGREVCDLSDVSQREPIVLTFGVSGGHPGTYPVSAEATVAQSREANPADNVAAVSLPIARPVGGLAAIAAASRERILHTGGIDLRIVPHISGPMTVSGTVSTPGGPVALTAVDAMATKGRARKVFLGTTRAALVRIRRGLQRRTSLPVRVTVRVGTASTSRTLHARR